MQIVFQILIWVLITAQCKQNHYVCHGGIMVVKFELSLG